MIVLIIRNFMDTKGARLSFLQDEEFFQKYWERSHVQYKGCATDLVSAFEMEGVFARFRFSPLELPDSPKVKKELQLMFRKMTVPFPEYIGEGNRARYRKIERYYKGGGTVIAGYIHQYSNRILSIVRELENCFACNGNINLYATPPGGQGFNIHADQHDVFVLQLIGEKKWNIYDTPMELINCFLDKGGIPKPSTTPTRELTMQPGDCLYIPRGEAHEAWCEDSLSVHLTIGLHSQYWNRVLQQSITEVAMKHRNFRESLRPDWVRNREEHADELDQRARNMLDQVISELDVNAALDSLLKKLPSMRELIDPNEIATAAALDSLRRGGRCRWPVDKPITLEKKGPIFTLHLPYRAEPLPLHSELYQSVLWMQEEGDFCPDEIPDNGETLADIESKRLFCRYLLDNGFLESVA